MGVTGKYPRYFLNLQVSLQADERKQTQGGRKLLSKET